MCDYREGICVKFVCEHGTDYSSKTKPKQTNLVIPREVGITDGKMYAAFPLP